MLAVAHTAERTLRVLPAPYDSPRYRAACALREAVLRAPLGLRLSARDLEGEAQQLHFVAIDEAEAVCGCVSAVLLDARHARLRQMAVAPAQQGRGVGATLLRAVEAELAARGVHHVMLHAREAGLGFYLNLGYTSIGECFTEIGLPHRRMEKTLQEGR